MDSYSNPYAETNFFGFFQLFFTRLFQGFPQEIFSDEIQILVLTAIALASALVGTFLVLRKMTMLANALSHTVLLGIVSAYLILFTFGMRENPHESLSLPILMVAAVATGLATTFLTEILTKVIRLQEDASIGLVFTTLFALGILLVTLFTKNVHVGTELIMGNVDALQKEDITLSLMILGVNLFVFTLFFKEFKVTTFDPHLAASLGFSPPFFNYLLMVLASGTAIGAFRAIGVLMVLAFFVVPPMIARLWTHSLSLLIVLAGGIGAFSSLVAVALSRHLLSVYGVSLSTGGLTVCLLLLIFCLSALPKFLPKNIKQPN